MSRGRTEVDAEPRQQRCTFCGYMIPRSVTPVGEVGQPFCSSGCREAFDADEEPFADDLGFKQRPIGVSALEAALPNGMPGNATVLLSGEEGTRREAILLEIVWRTLQRGEPAVLASVDKPPSVVVDSFLAHGWNVLPYLDDRQLVMLDLFTQRLSDEGAFSKRNNRWNSHLQSAFDDALVELREPGDVREVGNQLDATLENCDITNSGVVAIESLVELASFSQDVKAANFLKEMRAIVSKSRYVPLITDASLAHEEDLYPTDYPHDHEYLFDGIVDLELNDELVEGDRVKRLSVRKMDDTTVFQHWVQYEFRAGLGFVPIEPVDDA